MAMWPPPLTDGNESTSVGLSFLRKRRFKERNWRLPAIKMDTSPLTPADFRARRAKRMSAAWSAVFTGFWKMIMLAKTNWEGLCRPPTLDSTRFYCWSGGFFLALPPARFGYTRDIRFTGVLLSYARMVQCTPWRLATSPLSEIIN